MDPREFETISFSGLLQSLQELRGAVDSLVGNRELLRYALQIAAEREAAAEVLVELHELLETYAPAWYSEEQHERVESALQLLNRL